MKKALLLLLLLGLAALSGCLNQEDLVDSDVAQAAASTAAA